MQPFFDQKQKKISPPDHVVISETLPLPLVVIHGHFMNPPPPSSDHVVYGCPQIHDAQTKKSRLHHSK